jgi:carbamoyltransferase
MTTVLGISCHFHDSAASLIVDGALVAASAEERFSRRKHDSRYPRTAIDFCLARGGLGPGDVD